MATDTWVVAGRDLQRDVEALLLVVDNVDQQDLVEPRRLEEVESSTEKHFWAFAVLSKLVFV